MVDFPDESFRTKRRGVGQEKIIVDWATTSGVAHPKHRLTVLRNGWRHGIDMADRAKWEGVCESQSPCKFTQGIIAFHHPKSFEALRCITELLAETRSQLHDALNTVVEEEEIEEQMKTTLMSYCGNLESSYTNCNDTTKHVVTQRPSEDAVAAEEQFLPQPAKTGAVEANTTCTLEAQLSLQEEARSYIRSLRELERVKSCLENRIGQAKEFLQKVQMLQKEAVSEIDECEAVEQRQLRVASFLVKSFASKEQTAFNYLH